MTIRATQTVARFSLPFLPPRFDAPPPASEHRIGQDEALSEGIVRLAWRHNGAFIHLPAISSNSTTRQAVAINPADLDAAFQKDHELS